MLFIVFAHSFQVDTKESDMSELTLNQFVLLLYRSMCLCMCKYLFSILNITKSITHTYMRAYIYID